MHNAVIINSDFNNPAPTAKDIQAFLGKSGKLLYSSDKKKSVNTPYLETIHLVLHAFRVFENAIANGRNQTVTRDLYLLDEKVNETHFFLKYAEKIECHFKLDDAIIDEMHHCAWSFDHLKRHKESVEQDASSRKFFVENKIGSIKLHKAFPKFGKACSAYVAEIDDAMRELEEKAVGLFTSGW